MAKAAAVEELKCERRTMINFTKEQHTWLRKEAFAKHVSMSELVRQAVERLMKPGPAKTG